MLSDHFSAIRLVHVTCVALSGGLFTFRGLLRIADAAPANHHALRVLSYVIDSLLLAAAVALMAILHQYPFDGAGGGWLTAKVLLLLGYIALGIIALRTARTRAGRVAALASALTIFGLIIGVAITRDPLGWLSLMRR